MSTHCIKSHEHTNTWYTEHLLWIFMRHVERPICDIQSILGLILLIMVTGKWCSIYRSHTDCVCGIKIFTATMLLWMHYSKHTFLTLNAPCKIHVRWAYCTIWPVQCRNSLLNILILTIPDFYINSFSKSTVPHIILTRYGIQLQNWWHM